MSAEVTRAIAGKADEISATVSQRTSEMASVLSDKGGSVIAAITEKGEQFAAGLNKATDEAMQSIENSGLSLTRAMLDNSTEIARMINTAGETASNSINRTLNDLHSGGQTAIEQSASIATAAVNEMMETHNMLRADTTALFERLREANIMLQEVLSGSHANLSAFKNTLVLRVSELVSAMRRHHRNRRVTTRVNPTSPISARSPAAPSPILARSPVSSMSTAANSPAPPSRSNAAISAPRTVSASAAPRSTSWSPRSTLAPRISTSASSASPACSTSCSRPRPPAPAMSPAWCRRPHLRKQPRDERSIRAPA